MKNKFYLSLGSNIGDREHFIRTAIQLLDQSRDQLQVVQLSSFYETEPVGLTEQASFLNIAAKGYTAFTPEELLKHTQNIEEQLGRTREVRWGPRVIDIDILLYNNIRMNTEQLVIPHPRMTERAFVLVPLAEIEPDLILPGSSGQIESLVQSVEKEGVRLWKTN